MNQSRNSLGGKNMDGRITGARSSRASSTIFKKLKKLDREITEIDNKLRYVNMLRYETWLSPDVKKLKQRREKLDQKRKKTRALRKLKK